MSLHAKAQCIEVSYICARYILETYYHMFFHLTTVSALNCYKAMYLK